MKQLCLMILIMATCAAALGGQEFPLRQATEIFWEGTHVRSADGCEIVFWADAVNGDLDIFAQKISPSGQALWPAPLGVVNHSGDQKLWGAVKTSDNNIFVLWSECEIGTNTGLGAQKISSNGQKLWGELGVAVSMPGASLRLAVPVANATGSAFVVFQDIGEDCVRGQHLDASGNQLWPDGGLLLGDNILLEQACGDGGGGLIVNCSVFPFNRLMRISPAGEVMGNDPLLPPGAFPGNVYQLLSGPNGEFILYTVVHAPDPYILLNKMDITGNLLLPQTVQHQLAAASCVSEVALALYPDGGLGAAWRSGLDGALSWQMQRFSADLVPQWPSPGVEFSAPSPSGGNLSLAVGADATAWLAWYGGNVNFLEREVKAQAVSAAGIPLWGTAGKVLSQDHGRTCAIAWPDRGMFVWNPSLEGVKSLRRQIFTSSGSSFVPPEAEPLAQGLAGMGFLQDAIAIGNKYLTLWEDNREGNPQLYYQLSNDALDALLEPGGRPLWADETRATRLISAAKLNESSVALLYCASSDSVPFTCYLQRIDSTGNTLFPGPGIEVQTGQSSGTSMSLGCFEGEIYLIWQGGEAGSFQVKGQRYLEGQPQWGENGRVISTLGQDSHASQLAVRGRYFLWTNADIYLEQMRARALLVDQNGDPAPGWYPGGENLLMGSLSEVSSFQQSGLQGNDLVAFVSRYNGYASELRVQKLSAAGARLWGDGGRPFVSEIANFVYDAVFGDGVVCLLRGYGDGGNTLRAQKLSPDGDLLWGDSGVLLASGLNNCYDAALADFADGSFACVYSDDDGQLLENRDLYIRRVSSSGEASGTAPDLLCQARYQQRDVHLDVLGNRALVAWSDDRAGIENSEIAYTGVWATRIASASVAASDPSLNPAAPLVLKGNHPNPFNPSTTIAFSLELPQSVDLRIYNLKGQLVRALLRGAELPAGQHVIVWDGRTGNGESAASGVYFCCAQAGGYRATRKMLLSK